MRKPKKGDIVLVIQGDHSGVIGKVVSYKKERFRYGILTLLQPTSIYKTHNVLEVLLTSLNEIRLVSAKEAFELMNNRFDVHLSRLSEAVAAESAKIILDLT